MIQGSVYRPSRNHRPETALSIDHSCNGQSDSLLNGTVDVAAISMSGILRGHKSAHARPSVFCPKK